MPVLPISHPCREKCHGGGWNFFFFFPFLTSEPRSSETNFSKHIFLSKKDGGGVGTGGRLNVKTSNRQKPFCLLSSQNQEAVFIN